MAVCPCYCFIEARFLQKCIKLSVPPKSVVKNVGLRASVGHAHAKAGHLGVPVMGALAGVAAALRPRTNVSLSSLRLVRSGLLRIWPVAPWGATPMLGSRIWAVPSQLLA